MVTALLSSEQWITSSVNARPVPNEKRKDAKSAVPARTLQPLAGKWFTIRALGTTTACDEEVEK